MLSALHSDVIRATDMEGLINLYGALINFTRNNTSDEVTNYAERIERLIRLRTQGLTRLHIRRSGIARTAIHAWNQLNLN